MINKEILAGKLRLIVEGMLRIQKEENFTEDCPIGLIDFKQWEWSQGVGLYGLYRYYQQTRSHKLLAQLIQWYDERLFEGLPPKNVNTMAPMLTLAFLYEETHNPKYYDLCDEWCRYIMDTMPRTPYGGLQHICIDRPNTGQLWDDTLFMTVLFLAKWGKVTENYDLVQEAVYQFLLHSAYLRDARTGLWYHGWTFENMDNFAGAFWARGNCWITAVIVDFIEMVTPEPAVTAYLKTLLSSQVQSLRRFQADNGEWHTLLDDPSSYTEVSATAGFGYGILKGIRLGLLDESYASCGKHALAAVMDRIDDRGTVTQVSYGTAMGDTLDFYRKIPLTPMPYGQALALLLLCEGQLLKDL